MGNRKEEKEEIQKRKGKNKVIKIKKKRGAIKKSL